ncbi:MAG: hypothetical protein AAF754_01570 [Pseudomonadota bacterium]
MWDVLIWTGAGVTLIGLGLLLYCITKVARARKSGVDEEAMGAILQSVVAVNLGGLCLSAIGLMCVVLGIAFQ